MTNATTRPVGPNPSGLCMCGCGKRTRLAPRNSREKGWVKGEPVRFLADHNRRNPSSPYVVDETTGCWVWQWHVNAHGYGSLFDGGRTRRAHRVYYERRFGPIPDGLQLDHLCRNRACVNPDHMETVTAAENVRRGVAAKLNAEDVLTIRRNGSQDASTRRELAAQYGVSQGHIANIVSGRFWSNVAEEDNQ